MERWTIEGERQKDGEGMQSKGQRADGEQRRSEEKRRRQIDVKGKKDEKEVKLETAEGTDGGLREWDRIKKTMVLES